ncbi:MAG: hypothetical protein JWM53_2012, partial [bacterium]|nr:hypothetical protein [bacterium]
MKLAALALVLVAGCTSLATPMESIGSFDGEFGAAKEKRRVLAL